MLRKHNEIELVEQIDDKTCVAACLAMILGKSIETVISELAELGMACPLFDAETNKYLVLNNVLPYPMVGGAFEWDKTYIVGVMSKNYLMKMHAIVLSFCEEGTVKILDPQKGRGEYYDADDFRTLPWTNITSLTDCSGG